MTRGPILVRALVLALALVLPAASPARAQDAGPIDGGVAPVADGGDALLAGPDAGDDAGAGDAGALDAAAPDGGAEAPPDSGAHEAHDAGAPREAHEPPATAPTEGVPSEVPADAMKPTLPDVAGWVSAIPEVPGSLLAMFAVAILALVLAGAARRAREALPPEGLIPLAVAIAHLLLQLLVVLTVLAIGARLLPASLEPVVPWVLVGAAIAVGWSAREILPDVVGALVIAFERRVRPGTWVAGPDFAGLVERRGIRAVWIRDGHGNRLAVPNRHVVGTTVTFQLGAGPVHEVTVRLRTTRPPRLVREALHEATLISPWVRPEASPQIRQDGRDPELWHVRAHLLEMRFAALFEGDLLERAEEALARAGEKRDVDDWD
jgi:hypothetical protein